MLIRWKGPYQGQPVNPYAKEWFRPALPPPTPLSWVTMIGTLGSNCSVLSGRSKFSGKMEEGALPNLLSSLKSICSPSLELKDFCFVVLVYF